MFSVCVYVCVCVCEREREIDREYMCVCLCVFVKGVEMQERGAGDGGEQEAFESKQLVLLWSLRASVWMLSNTWSVRDLHGLFPLFTLTLGCCSLPARSVQNYYACRQNVTCATSWWISLFLFYACLQC